MKIDWSKAPEWANWVARDANGVWCWHSQKPHLSKTEWTPKVLAEYWTFIERAAIRCNTYWRLSLSKRPTEMNK